MNEEFTIMGLEPGDRYTAMVCRAGDDTPSDFSFSPMCGYCRLCFTTTQGK